MKAEELRIGNYLALPTRGADECRVEGVVEDLDSKGFYYVYCDLTSNEWPIGDYAPIPITEEWLLKFGFEGRINETSQCGNFYLGYDAEYGRHRMSLWYQKGSWCFNHTNTFTVLKYVHQLQNLYYALTGEEL